MDLFDLDRSQTSGVCRSCQASSLYSKATCDHCGARLPWADGVACELGEKCRHCAAFNTYARRSCSQCGELLPWCESLAALYHAQHNSEKEQKSLAWAVVLSLIAVSIVLQLVGYFLWARP